MQQKNSDDRKDSNKESDSARKKPSDKGQESKNKFTEALDSLKKGDKMDTVVKYAKTHTPDTIAYILLVIGIVWLFFNSFYGGILVGLVAGFYFTQEILDIVSSADRLFEEHGLAKNLIFAGTILALFILAPGIFIGAAIMVGIKYLLKSQV